MKGTNVCLAHGGAAPQVAAAARRRAVQADAEAVLIRLDVEPLEDPLSQLAQLAGQAKAWMDVMGARVNTLSSLRYEGTGAGEQLRAEVGLFERAMDRLERFCVSMARLNIDERLAEISETQSRVIASFVMAALGRFGIDIQDEETNRIVMGLFDQAAKGDDHVLQLVAETPRAPEISAVCEWGQHEKCLSYLPSPGMPPPPWPERCPCECHNPATGGLVPAPKYDG